MLNESYEETVQRFAYILKSIPNVGDRYRQMGIMHSDFNEFWEMMGCQLHLIDYGMKFTDIVRVQPERQLVSKNAR